MLWLLLAVPVVILALALGVTQPARPPRKPPPPIDEMDEDPLDLLARDAPAALARYGTPEVAAMLEAQGRGDELRGLGYRGGE